MLLPNDKIVFKVTHKNINNKLETKLFNSYDAAMFFSLSLIDNSIIGYEASSSSSSISGSLTYITDGIVRVVDYGRLKRVLNHNKRKVA